MFDIPREGCSLHQGDDLLLDRALISFHYTASVQSDRADIRSPAALLFYCNFESGLHSPGFVCDGHGYTAHLPSGKFRLGFIFITPQKNNAAMIPLQLAMAVFFAATSIAVPALP
ncbi:hypothetical protein [Paenibacillus xerothermodurans]|nr:hypothetical protein [Paenibacillus xerothermodurans]